jgi:hypothetical protein
MTRAKAHWLAAFKQKKLCQAQAERTKRSFDRRQGSRIAAFPEYLVGVRALRPASRVALRFAMKSRQGGHGG